MFQSLGEQAICFVGLNTLIVSLWLSDYLLFKCNLFNFWASFHWKTHWLFKL